MSGLLSGTTKIVSSGVESLVSTTTGASDLVINEVEDVVDALITRRVGKTDDVGLLDLLPGLDSLGCGYDVLNGYYADPQSCKTNLFLFNDLVQYSFNGTGYAAPNSITVISASGSNLSIASGSSIESFTSSLAASVSVSGSYNFFSASVKASIGQSTARNIEKHFTRVQENIRQYTLQLPPSNQRRSFLRPEVLKDIDTATDLEQLFKDYGTHYVAGLLMGGRATYTCSTSKTKFHSSTDIKVVAEMSYRGMVGSLSASVETQYKKEIDSFRANSDKKVETRGGDPSLGGDTYVEHPQEWKNSVANDVAFVEFLSDGLVGIWELASTTERTNELKAYYPEYCKNHKESFELVEPYLRAKFVPLPKAQFDDSGSQAKLNLTAAVPDVGNGWYYLGQVAIAGKGNALSGADQTIVVKELVENSGILVEVDHWEKVWTDEGSGLNKNYDLWRGVSGDPINYYVVGDFFHVNPISTSRPAPSAEQTAGIRAVHQTCLVPAAVGTQVWNSQGTPSKTSAGVWNITAKSDDAVDMKTALGPFVSVASATDKPQRPVYILKASAVVLDED